jgi:beta-glucosidase
MHLLGVFPLLPAITYARSIYSLQESINNAPGFDWDAALAKAEAFVAQLDTPEKVNLVTGGADVGPCTGNIGPVERLGFRGLCMADGPAGVNRADLVSVFPAGLATAATWDLDLVYQRGQAIGAEYKGKGVHVMLG